MSGDDRQGPPRLARLVLRLAVRRGERALVDGELTELYRRRVAKAGMRSAGHWYRRQVLGFVLRARSTRELDRTAPRPPGGRRWLVSAGSGEWLSELRWALRGARHRPAFAAVSVLTLMLGIGANTAIYSLVDAYFLQPLPYLRPQQLVLVWETERDTLAPTTVAPGNYFAWRESATSLCGIEAFNVDRATVSGGGPAEDVAASVVTPGFFALLGAQPLLGRGFDEGSVRESAGQEVVLGYSLFVRRFGGDPGIVGRNVRIDGQPHRVVGVMPAAFRQPERSLAWQRPELWRPMDLADQHEDFGSRYLRTVARLAPGASVVQAREEMAVIGARLAAQHPDTDAGRQVLVRTLDQHLLSDSRSTLFLLLAAGAAVLLVACANVVNLGLARGQERRRELAVRAALGSGSGRLLRQVLWESLGLALVGGALGCLLVLAGRDLLQSLQARFFSGLVDVRVDARVVLFTVAIAVAAGLSCGWLLARSALRTGLAGSLGAGGARAGAGPASGRLRRTLIVAQVAIATALLAMAALLVRSFDRLVSVPTGFESRGIVTFTVVAPRAGYPSRDDVRAYFVTLQQELESLAGVARVGLISDLPFTTENRYTTLEPGADGSASTEAPRAEFHVASPEYFEAMGIPLLRGALYRERWQTTAEEVPALVDSRLANTVWPGRDPLGRSFSPGWREGVRCRVVGVVGDVLDDGFDASPDPTFYVPWGGQPNRRMSVVVRFRGSAGAGLDGVAEAALERVRRAVFRVDPDLPAGDLQTLSSLLDETVARPRGASTIGVAFALLALLVAAAGIHGLMSYAVQVRTREIGVRAALGAGRRRLMVMILAESARLLGLGAVLGLGGAVLAGALLSGLLFGVRSWDPPSLIAAISILLGVGMAAAWLPARRAVRIDPSAALRQD